MVVPAMPATLVIYCQLQMLVYCARLSRDEFVGTTSGYPYIEARGDIPGARWGCVGNERDVNRPSDFHNPDGTMKTRGEICDFWRKAGIHADRQTAFYYSTGWRASLAFFYAWLMNWERVSVYDGGSYEWRSDPGNPRA